MEHVGVARVERVAPVRLARHDDRDRRRMLFHHADLHRRRVGAQHDVGAQVERVEPFARGMILGDVERVEVVVVAFDLRPEHDREPVPLEVRADVVDRAADRVDRAQARGGAGHRDVDRDLQRRFEFAQAQLLRGAGQRGLHRLDGGIDHLSRGRPFGRWERADRAADGGHFAAAAEICDAHVFEFAFARHGRQGSLETGRERGQLIFENSHAKRLIRQNKTPGPLSERFVPKDFTVPAGREPGACESGRRGALIHLAVQQIRANVPGASKEFPEQLGRVHRRFDTPLMSR